MEIRNIAIIAHVDHGKTTLTDALMKQNGGLQDEGVSMDSKEGIGRVVFDIPTRGLLDYRSEFIIDTKGEEIMSSRVIGFREYAGEIKKREGEASKKNNNWPEGSFNETEE